MHHFGIRVHFGQILVFSCGQPLLILWSSSADYTLKCHGFKRVKACPPFGIPGDLFLSWLLLYLIKTINIPVKIVILPLSLNIKYNYFKWLRINCDVAHSLQYLFQATSSALARPVVKRTTRGWPVPGLRSGSLWR